MNISARYLCQGKAEEGGDAVASLTDDNIGTVLVLCNDANSECLVL